MGSQELLLYRSVLRPIVLSFSFPLLVSLAVESPLCAQAHDESGRYASFTAGASFGDGETALALSTGLGFHFSSRFGLAVELAYARKLDFTLDLCPAPRVCVLGGQLPVTGRTVALVPHLLIELFPVPRRLRSYVQAGVGAGHVRQRYFSGPPLTGSLPERVELTRSSPTVAFSIGGGAALQISRRLTVGADVRSQFLLDEETADPFILPSGVLSTFRVGSSVSWQF